MSLFYNENLVYIRKKGMFSGYLLEKEVMLCCTPMLNVWNDIGMIIKELTMNKTTRQEANKNGNSSF